MRHGPFFWAPIISANLPVQSPSLSARHLGEGRHPAVCIDLRSCPLADAASALPLATTVRRAHKTGESRHHRGSVYKKYQNGLNRRSTRGVARQANGLRRLQRRAIWLRLLRTVAPRACTRARPLHPRATTRQSHWSACRLVAHDMQRSSSAARPGQ